MGVLWGGGKWGQIYLKHVVNLEPKTLNLEPKTTLSAYCHRQLLTWQIQPKHHLTP